MATIKHLELPIEGSDLLLKAVEITGSQPGKTLLVTAGVHGSEYPGIKALLDLIEVAPSLNLSGKLILIPVVNEAAFYEYSRFVSPQDNFNLNRAFPGELGQGFTRALAYTLQTYGFAQADYYLDLHSGDTSELAMPFAYAPGLFGEALLEKEVELASYLNIELWTVSRSSVGAVNYAAQLGIPSLLIERGGQGILKLEEAVAYKEDILNVMKYLDMLEEAPIRYNNQLGLLHAHYEESETEGLWLPRVGAGERFKEKDLLGVLKNLKGEVLKEVYAVSDGIVLYLTTSLGVKTGDPLIAYGKL